MTMFASQWFAKPAPPPAPEPDFDTTLIGNSVWLDGSADYLTRQNGSAFSDGKKAIFSLWVKRDELGRQQAIFGSEDSDYYNFRIMFNDQDQLWVYAKTAQYVTTRKFRDMGYYGILVSVDSTESTATDRIKIWVNGEQETSFGLQTTLALNDDSFGISTAQSGANHMRLGVYHAWPGTNFYYFAGYIAQACMLESNSIQNGDFAVSDFPVP